MNEKRRILVVEDEQDISTYLAALLEDNGYEVITADNGIAGLEIARSQAPDLITLDMALPDQSGVRTYRKYKEDPQLQKIPVIIVSAKTLSPPERERIRDYAESVWLKGSFSARELVNHMVRVVEEESLTVRAPDAMEKEAKAAAEEPIADFGKGQRQRILIVDDYAPEARLVRRLLETRQRFEIMEAHSGQEALDVIEKMPPDLIILDLMLPDIGGETLLGILRTQETTQNIPVVIATAKDLDKETRARLSANVDSIWLKSSLDRSSMLSHIESILPE
mgnify:CR=1 FL=1